MTDQREHLRTESREPTLQMKNNAVADGFRLNTKAVSYSPTKTPGKEVVKSIDNSGSDSERRAQKDVSPRINLGKTIKGRESGSPEAASQLLLDPANDSTIPTEVGH